MKQKQIMKRTDLQDDCGNILPEGKVVPKASGALVSPTL